MKTLDENMIEDAIIRKRATLFIGGGAPKTFTRLYLYPALVEVAKSRNLNDVLNAYGYFMPIPVSPDHLEYKRGASHNEAYGIVSGGLLQRNLPKLWHLSIETYLPRDIYERTFHNWSQDREWSGEYTQQHFVDYINLIMQYKIPLAMYDSSSPERIRHNCEYWCIEQFNYKMLPHDDIDYTLDLIEWREPHVKLSEVEMKEVTQTPTGPSTRRGDGTALMVFGDNDNRVFNRGEVYDARVKLAFSMQCDRTVLGYEKLSDLQRALGSMPSSEKSISASGWSATLHYDETVSTSANTIKIPYTIEYGTEILPAFRKTLRNCAMHAMQCEFTEQVARTLKSQAHIKLDADAIGYYPYGGMEAQGSRSNLNAVLLFSALNSGERTQYDRGNLHINAWCTLREVRKNVPLYTIAVDAKKESYTEHGVMGKEDGYVTISIKRKGVWFEEMYVVSPIAGTKLETYVQNPKQTTLRGDLYYDAKQSWLVPKQNTIRTSYKKYLATVLVNNGTIESTSTTTTNASGVEPNKDNNLQVKNELLQAIDEGWTLDYEKMLEPTSPTVLRLINPNNPDQFYDVTDVLFP